MWPCLTYSIGKALGQEESENNKCRLLVTISGSAPIFNILIDNEIPVTLVGDLLQSWKPADVQAEGILFPE